MTSGWRYVVRQLLLILGIALLACLFLAFGLMEVTALWAMGEILGLSYL